MTHFWHRHSGIRKFFSYLLLVLGSGEDWFRPVSFKKKKQMDGMTIVAIVTSVIGSEIVIKLPKMIRDWKAGKKDAKSSSKKNDYEAQKEGLDLVSVFYDKVKKLTDEGNEDLKVHLREIDNDVKAVKAEQALMAEFLNGEFEKFKKTKKARK